MTQTNVTQKQVQDSEKFRRDGICHEVVEELLVLLYQLVACTDRCVSVLQISYENARLNYGRFRSINRSSSLRNHGYDECFSFAVGPSLCRQTELQICLTK